MLTYIGPIFIVDEIAPSRRFYEELLGQKVKYDFGVNVTFEGNLAIHLKSHYQALLGDAAEFPIGERTHNGVVCFETDDIDLTCHRLQQEQITFIHPIQEQPWGQRVVRVYDPGGHVVEIGENMEAVVRRFHGQGLSPDEISTKTGMPREFVENALRKHA